MHDPRVIEYMGAPESARLLGRTPEYWLEHMGRERTIQAALRLHHDAINVSVPIIFRVLYVGPGARLAASLEGRGARLQRHPGSNYLGYISNGHLV